MFKNLKFSKNFLVLFFSVTAICFFLIDYTREADIWFLLSHGRYVLNNGFPHVDVLSMHTGLNFVMQQWLSSVIFYIVYNYLGKIAFYIFIFLMNLVITYLIYKLCVVISNKKFSSCFITVITMILLQRWYIVPRPQIFTFIILIMVLIMLELYSSKRKKYINYMPLLSVLLINFHGSMWPMIFVFCMPYVAELILKKDKDVFKLIGVIIISLVAGLINPYGLESLTYSINSYGLDSIRTIVGEMRSFNLLGEDFVVYWSFFTLLIFFISNLLILKYSKKKNIRVAHLLLFYGTFFMALSSLRNISLFIIATLPFLVKYFEFKDINTFSLSKEWCINYVVILILFIAVFTSSIFSKKYEFVHDVDEAVIYLNEYASKDIKLYTEYSFGSLFEYHGYKPYLDSRAEVFTKKMNNKEDILDEYIKFNLDKNSRDKFIKKYDFDYYLIHSDYKELVNYLINYQDIDYELVYAREYFYLVKKVSE